MDVGYARVSRGDHQDVATQVRILQEAGCGRLYREEASGGDAKRPQLEALLASLQPGDTLVVWKLDRLSRSLADLLAIMARLEIAGAGFRSLTEAIDTTTPVGRMLMQLLGSFAEFERAMIRQRTLAGLETARLKGHKPGRRPSLGTSQKAVVIRMITEEGATNREAASLFRVSIATVKRVMKAHRATLLKPPPLAKGGRPRILKEAA